MESGMVSPNPMDPFRYYSHISRLVYLAECKNISAVARAFGEKRKGTFYALNFLGDHFGEVYRTNRVNQIEVTPLGYRIASDFRPHLEKWAAFHDDLEAIRIAKLHQGIHEEFPETAKPFHGIDPYLDISPTDKSIVICIQCKIRMMVRHTTSVVEWIEKQLAKSSSSFSIIRGDKMVI